MKNIPATDGGENLVQTGDWQTWTPRDALSPAFSRDGSALKISGKGNRYCFGRWQCQVPVEGGKAYRVTMQFRWQAIDDPNLHVLNAVFWRHADVRREGRYPQDAVMNWRQKGKWVVADEVFVAPPNTTHAAFHLYLRYTPGGSVWWRGVTISPAQVPHQRVVKVAAVRCWKCGCMDVWESFLDQAGKSGADLVLLPEHINARAAPIQDFAETMQGPTVRLLSSKARRYHMNVCGGFAERDGSFFFNTAVLFDRRGRLIGKYRKIHLYWTEGPYGTSPGSELPVFTTDIGKVGIMICYDSWWPETARLLGLKGAEIILFPNAGYDPKIMPARAIDNGVYLVVASLNSPSAIYNSLGEILTATKNLTATSPNRMITASFDVRNRPHPHANDGGVLNGSPAGHRVTRNARDARLYREILEEAKRWSGPR